MEAQQFIQGSDEWHAWRAKGLGASEIPIVMGESDFTTPLQLWERKTGRLKEQPQNFAMKRGSDSEAKIRSLYELQTGMEFPPAVVVHPHKEFLRASLDGWNREKRIIAEFKYPSLEKHRLAQAGEVPRTYYGQLQAQILCADAEENHYVSYQQDMPLAVVVVKRDPEYIERMIAAATVFWVNVLGDVPPELTDRDFLEIKDNERLLNLFNGWAQAKSAVEESTKRLEQMKKLIVEATREHKRVRCGSFRLATISRKGSVDYSKIPQLSGINLEEFRKPATSYVQISVKGGA